MKAVSIDEQGNLPALVQMKRVDGAIAAAASATASAFIGELVAGVGEASSLEFSIRPSAPAPASICA
jgi:hypothetical protein